MTPYKNRWFEVSTTFPGTDSRPCQGWVKIYEKSKDGTLALILGKEAPLPSNTEAEARRAAEEFAQKLIDAMGKLSLTPEQYVEEMNQRLSRDFQFESRMRVFLTPKGADGKTAHGISFEGPEVTRGLIAAIDKEIQQEFNVVLPPWER